MIIKFSAKHTIALLCGRRSMLVFTTVFLNYFTVPNLAVYFYGSIFLMAYYLRIRPFDTKWAYWLELFNETHIIVSGYFCLFFTEWIRNIQTKYQTGNLFVDITFWVIIINQLGIFYEVYLSIRLERKKRIYEMAWRRHYMYKTYLA